MTIPTVLYDHTDGVARVTLNRPEVLNAYNLCMRDELFELLQAIRDDPAVRVLVVQGAGRAFCAGADLTEFGTAPSPTVARQVRFARDIWTLLAQLPMPRIAALHGFVFGSGLEMALLCDIRLAAEGTRFGLPEVRLGMIPAAGGTQTLPRVVGTGTALDLLLTGRSIDTAEALGLGLITRVVSGERLGGEVDALAATLAALDKPAVQAVCRAVREGLGLTLDQGLRLEARLAASLRGLAVAERDA